MSLNKIKREEKIKVHVNWEEVMLGEGEETEEREKKMDFITAHCIRVRNPQTKRKSLD